MKELAGRLAALDPDAGAAFRVIGYFDTLEESRAGLKALVRGAAVLAGCPARLAEPQRRARVRVEADGTRRHPTVGISLTPSQIGPSLRRLPVRTTESKRVSG